jgi:hypothetical protein
MVEDLAGILNLLSNDIDITKSIGTLVPGHINLCSSIVRCLVVLLSGGKFTCSSPHVRAKIGDVIYQCFFSQRKDSQPLLPLSLFSDNFFVSKLLPSLLQLYGDVEPTGFYAAVMHRGKLSIIIKHLLSDPKHRNSLLTLVSNQVVNQLAPQSSSTSSTSMGEVKIDEEEATETSQNEFNFISTANGLMNQANSAITDGLTQLEEIKVHQDAIKDITMWQAQSEEERKDAEEQYAENERNAKHYLNTAMKALDLLEAITSHMRTPFMNQVLLGRLSSTLTTLLRKLIESQTALKVDNPEKYDFNAKEMLRKVITTCLHMYGDKTEDNSGENNNEEYRAQFCSSFASPFVENFDTKMLDRATKILRKYNILHAKDFETWTQLVDAVKTEVQ